MPRKPSTSAATIASEPTMIEARDSFGSRRLRKSKTVLNSGYLLAHRCRRLHPCCRYTKSRGCCRDPAGAGARGESVLAVVPRRDSPEPGRVAVPAARSGPRAARVRWEPGCPADQVASVPAARRSEFPGSAADRQGSAARRPHQARPDTARSVRTAPGFGRYPHTASDCPAAGTIPASACTSRATPAPLPDTDDPESLPTLAAKAAAHHWGTACGWGGGTGTPAARP